MKYYITGLMLFGLWVFGQVNFVTSNLPIIKINTPIGQQINDITRIVCDMGVIDQASGSNNVNDAFNNYNGKIAIEIRGSTSQQYPKKSYGFETQTATGINNNVTLLGLPSENDWILNGPYPDKTLLRDAMTYEISRKMGHYASRFRFCELLINDEYLGVYILFERIKRDNNRVDIAHLDLDDLAGDSLTGGYIFKVDKLTGESGITWNSNFSNEVVFQFHDPESDELQPAQISYLQTFVSDFENAIQANPEANYNQWIEPTSFYDFFILQELGRTVDGYRSSSFMYKDKNSGDFQGRLVAGPMWDFNLSYGNADYCDAFLTTGWQYNFDQICNFTTQIPFWWKRLLDSPSYRNGLKCRWNELRQGILQNDSLVTWIDSMANYLQEARIRNFQKWPIIGQYINWNAYVGATYAEDLNFFKTYLQNRASWIDANLPGVCNLSIEINENIPHFEVYPNPANALVSINTESKEFILSVADAEGSLLLTCSNCMSIDLSTLANGIYFISLQNMQGQRLTKRIIKQ
ncbi:MAG: CotH kinase family protein [Flavobacteriales bacterium]